MEELNNQEPTDNQKQNTGSDTEVLATPSTAFSRSFNLKFGYKDKEDSEIIHREVVISRRPTGKDLIQIAENDLDADETLSSLGLVAAMISRFGKLTMPVPITVLLQLNEIDTDKLRNEFSDFLSDSTEGKEAKVLDDGRAQLAFGINREGVNYDVVEFGNLLNGYDRININKEAKNPAQFKALKIAQEVAKLSTADGSKSISGALTLAEMESLDLSDIIVLMEAESQWLDSFRD